MDNPFKFGTLVDEPYFTDRVEELARIGQFLKSENHLVLISPRRYGKSSLVRKAVRESGRPCMGQHAAGVEQGRLCRETLEIYFQTIQDGEGETLPPQL